jgi:hypothetical protein
MGSGRLISSNDFFFYSTHSVIGDLLGARGLLVTKDRECSITVVEVGVTVI